MGNRRISYGGALRLYEQLTDAGEDKARAKLIAEAFEVFEARYPDFKGVATQGHLRESELRLRKEIQPVRLEIKEAESRLQEESQLLRLEIKEVDIRLTQAIHRQTLWVIMAMSGVTGLVYWLDRFLK
ncbi:DUF1640 domain-containing protein [Gammaproteobacteria bacterium]